MRTIGNGWLVFWLLAGLMGAMLSGLGSRGSAPDDAFNEAVERYGPDSSSEDSEESDRSDDSYASISSDATVLKRNYDGHFYADVEINGQRINMLVDTGASGIALSRDDARRAGVGVSIGMPQVVGQGASGDVHGEIVTLDRVSLGSAQAEGIRAIVLDTGGQSLLGQSFLSEFESVEIKDDRMILE